MHRQLKSTRFSKGDFSWTLLEIQILVCLAKQAGKVFTKEQLYNEVYGDEKIVDVNNAVYCIIRNIQKKLKNVWKCHEYIQTVRGVGYKFVVPEE